MSKYTVQHYGARFFALYDHDTLVCVTVYKKGAAEVMRRLEQSQGEQYETAYQRN